MPTNDKKLSQQPVVATLLPGDRLPVLRRAADETDPGKRNPTVGAEALATWLAPFLNAGLLTVDLLELTTNQMNEVLALAYTDGDAAPAASPAWSYPGMQFDALYNGENRHYYCTRGTYDPTAPAGTTGQGPAWHYFQKRG